MSDERDFLLESLRDLDAERAAGDLTPEDYAALRDDYTSRAAAAIRGDAAPAAPRRRVWPVVVALVVVAGLAGVLVARSAGQRLPSDELTGSIESTTADKLMKARQFIADGKAVDALKTYDAILKANPKEPEALAYRGWLLRLAGQADAGLAYIDRAIAADKAYPDAHFFRGMILWQDHRDPAGAVPEFQLFLASNPPPDGVPAVQQALQQAQAEAAAKSPG